MTERHRYGTSYCGNYTNGLMISSSFTSNSLLLMTILDKPIGGFRVTYNVSDCGGVLDGSNAVITSPGYPNNYPPNIHCNWFLQVPFGEVMKITFVDLRLEEDCTKDYVLIRNTRSLRSTNTIGKFCGSQTVASLNSGSDVIVIEFHSDAFGTAPGFKISTSEVQRGCGGLIHNPMGNISSPNYPSRYSNNVECVWIIEYSPGYLVNMKFTGRFDIEMDSTCSKDYIQFDEMDDDGRWIFQSKKCGSITPQPLVSKSNKMRIIFHSNERIVGDGFNLHYTTDCGGNFTRPTGDILSPNYPNLYTNNLNCTYTIGKQGDYISLTFDDYFSLEIHPTCGYDYVEIYQKSVNESNKQGGYCGSEVPAPRTLMGPVTVRFVTDYAYVAHGFKLHYEVLTCGAVLTAPSGVISSPNTTGSFITHMDCKWRIIAPPNKVIQIRFLYFHMQASYGCYTEYLEVNDGNESSPLVGRFCGEGVQNAKSTGNEITLRYRTNYPSNEKGFSVYYYYTYGPRDGCGGGLNASTGQISSLDTNSDGFYEPNLDCGWVIYTSATDQSIKIEFNSFDLQMPSNGTCQSDFLEIREHDMQGNLLARYCGNTLPPPLMTSLSRVFIHFHSDGSGSNSGFRITYSIVPSPCGMSELIAERETKTLTSPNYPSIYPVNLRCQWRILRNSSNFYGSPIEIAVTDMDIPCGGDFLQIKRLRVTRFVAYDTTKDCGSTPPQVIKIRQPLITFNSDALNNGGRGFSLTYRYANCNTTYSTDSGVILSDTYPSRVNFGYRCRINITVSAGKTIALYFKDFSFVSVQQCETNYMKIYNGGDASSPVLASYCGVSVPNPVFSTGNSLHLDVIFPNRIAFYHMTYMASEKANGCGGSIFASDGAFTSPLYPQPYNKTGDCSWHITVPGYHTIVLQLDAFSLNSTRGCEVNFLEIYEGSTADVSNKVVRYCGQDSPSRHELRTNDALVRLVTDTTNDKPGFFMIFSSSGYLPALNPTYLAQRFPTAENLSYLFSTIS